MISFALLELFSLHCEKMLLKIKIPTLLFVLFFEASPLWCAIPVCDSIAADTTLCYADSIVADSMVSPVMTAGERIVEKAMRYIGARYGKGQNGPKCFDCSGFTRFIYGKEDIPIQRTSQMQFSEGQPIDSISRLRKGDLVFFGGRRATKSAGHVGIVTNVASDGNSFKFIHACRTGVTVTHSDSLYYRKRYLGARRIIQE